MNERVEAGSLSEDLFRLIAEVRAEAWDEGWQKAHSSGEPAVAGIFINPYRKFNNQK